MNLDEKIIFDTILKSNVCLVELSRSLNVSVLDLEVFLKQKTGCIENSEPDIFSKEKTDNKVKIFIDGGSRGNPGESGSGVVIVDNCKKGYYFYNGITTNNEAEYIGLIKALSLSKELGFSKLEIFSDSELMCKQINGHYKVNSDKLLKFYSKAKDMIVDFNSVLLKHIPREQNKDADKMANLAMDLKKDGKVELTVVR